MSLKRPVLLFAAFFLYLIPLKINAQVELSSLEFFEDDVEIDVQILDAKMESDWKKLRKEKTRPKYQAAEMTFYLSENDSIEVDLKIKPRGEFRRAHCFFPPIWLNFKKGDFENSSVSEYDKIKLVTHCKDQTSYKQQLIIEYYIYKMYEMLTDYSFRTRLIRINYADTLNKRSPGWNYGILLEDEKQMAIRQDGVIIKDVTMHPERLDRMKATLMDVFQFMIGNTDWSVVYQHNVKLLKLNDPTQYTPIPIPYDFDYCGLVDASYAVPPEKLDLESVKDRLYRGYCRSPEEFQSVFDLFNQNKEEFIAMFENSQLLDKSHRISSVQYLSQFFEIIENENLVKRNFLDVCQ